LHHRRSVRLKDYDYSQEGAYFVTVSAHNRECLFGDVVNEKMRLSPVGQIVRDEWLRTESIRRDVTMDEFVVMPNHLHGIICIRRGTLQRAPTVERFGKPASDSLPTIVRLFKSATTKRVNILRNMPGTPVWQRNYYEHIIRDEDDLNRISQYIQDNVLQWVYDKENPINL